MSQKAYSIQAKTDTKQNWLDNDPVLLDREIGYERETGQAKMGDGVTPWSQLPYMSVGIRGGGAGAEIFNGYDYNEAEGTCSHAEGSYTHAFGSNAHAEGEFTYANDTCSHAEGSGTQAWGYGAHTEGMGTSTSAWGAHAEGIGTVATDDAQHVQGKYNLLGSEAFVIGNGTEQTRSNAFTVDWNGNIQSQAFYNDIVNRNGVTWNQPNTMTNPSLYVGTFKQTWQFEDWYNEIPLNIILSKFDPAYGTAYEIMGTITEVFPVDRYDIIVNLCDNTIQEHYEELSKLGIQMLSDGTLYIHNKHITDGKQFDLDVNISVYYIGEGVFN